MKQYFEYDPKTGRVHKTPDHPDYGKDVRYHDVLPDTPEYHSPIDGRLVSGRKERRADMARSGSRPWEGLEQEKKEAARQRQYKEDKQRQIIKQMIESKVREMPESQRRELIRY